MNTKGPYNFNAKAAQYRAYNMDALHFAANDIRETLKVWPDHPNAGWYMDDLHTVTKEIGRRLGDRSLGLKVRRACIATNCVGLLPEGRYSCPQCERIAAVFG
ncbi:MAG: hypothetical protein JRC86_00565 [Deltaproteobacteria bacterium]|nr:hypothetical protein [Deltaproteobacteria bacterium]